MRRGLSLIAALGLLGVATPAVAADPTVRTVPWVPANTNIPHDILSRSTGGVAPGAITSITISSLSTCGGAASNFTLNGVVVGSTPPNGCTCSPVVQTATINTAAALAAWDPSAVAANSARVVKAAGTHYGWAKMTVTLAGGGTETSCVSDRTGTNCGTSNLCHNNTHNTVAADDTTVFGGGNDVSAVLKAVADDADGNQITVAW